MGDVLKRRVFLSPNEKDANVDNERREEVDKHPANHNEEALPSGFRTKLIGFHGLLHLLGVHRFVNHPCDFYITAKGKPPEVVICALVRKEFEREPRVKEKAEFLNANLKETCEEEVSALVKRDKEGEA